MDGEHGLTTATDGERGGQGLELLRLIYDIEAHAAMHTKISRGTLDRYIDQHTMRATADAS
jgi:hypothetical protein